MIAEAPRNFRKDEAVGVTSELPLSFETNTSVQEKNTPKTYFLAILAVFFSFMPLISLTRDQMKYEIGGIFFHFVDVKMMSIMSDLWHAASRKCTLTPILVKIR